MNELFNAETLIKRLRYQGRQYAAGQTSRGGSSGPHLLEQAADELERLYFNVEAAIAFCPTCCQGVTASPNMTHDELIFQCGKVAGRAEANRKDEK